MPFKSFTLMTSLWTMFKFHCRYILKIWIIVTVFIVHYIVFLLLNSNEIQANKMVNTTSKPQFPQTYMKCKVTLIIAWNFCDIFPKY